MAVLEWKHGKTKSEAIAVIQGAIADAGYGDSVKWTGDRFEGRAGPFASLLHITGEVTNATVVIEKCTGVASGPALSQGRAMLEKLFPSGGSTA